MHLAVKINFYTLMLSLLNKLAERSMPTHLPKVDWRHVYFVNRVALLVFLVSSIASLALFFLESYASITVVLFTTIICTVTLSLNRFGKTLWAWRFIVFGLIINATMYIMFFGTKTNIEDLLIVIGAAATVMLPRREISLMLTSCLLCAVLYLLANLPTGLFSEEGLVKIDKDVYLWVLQPLKATYLLIVLFELLRSNIQNERAMRASNVQLAIRNRENVALFRKVAEELREPYRRIRDFGKLLLTQSPVLNDAELRHESKMYGEFVVAGSEQMSKLIDKISLYADLHTRQAKESSFSVKELLDETLRSQEGMAFPKCLVDTATLGSEQMTGDFSLARKSVLLLLENSYLYNDSETPTVRVSSRIAEDGNVQILFSDNGVGIPSKYQELLFKPFSRLPNHPGVVQGFGMGLSVCRRAMESMGGKAFYLPSSQQGSTFVLEFQPASTT